jgi:hypothetical protein
MSSDHGRVLLQNGIDEAKAGNKKDALSCLNLVVGLYEDPGVLAEAWYWIGELTDDPSEKRKALKNCLAHDGFHTRARKTLAILDGKLKADEIIDPDRLPHARKGLRPVDAERFICPNCGGRMSFSPDGQSLVCDYCSQGQGITGQQSVADEKDFVIAMATARGHSKSLNQQVFHCEGCGCEFILPPDQISSTCTYCDTPYVVHWETDRELLAPDGIIPHTFSQRRAIHFFVRWTTVNHIKPEKKVKPLRGLYLPVWTFDLGGRIKYTAELDDENTHPIWRAKSQRTRVNGAYPVHVNDMLIPASRKLSALFMNLLPTFDWKAIRPYDTRYLASWPAEVYDIPLAEASLEARAQTLERYKKNELMDSPSLRLISRSSAEMTVESFRLNLFPVWMTEIFFEGRSSLILINGQNGTLVSILGEHRFFTSSQ